MEAEIPLAEKQRIADTIHRNFVDKMWASFGLPSHPGYCPIEFSSLISCGGVGINPLRIFICNDYPFSEEEIRH